MGINNKYIHPINYIIYFLFHYLCDNKFRKLRQIKIASPIETINYIINNKVSVSRFGDGEIGLMSGNNSDFQCFNPSVSNKLKEVLNSKIDGHIVCLPYPWTNFWSLKYQAFEYWSSYLNNNLESKIIPHVDFDRKYFDASFTRFYIDYKSDRNARKLIPLIKKIWEKRNVCIIEGEYTRLGVGNDLLDNANDISRIIAPSINAFNKYDEILNAVRKYASKSDLVLIALGMTATCLAYDLAKEGYQAIDIGHVDIEYEWFRMKAKSRVPIANKYVAESKERLLESGEIDNSYIKQVKVQIL